jgi:hypothetical protein
MCSMSSKVVDFIKRLPYNSSLDTSGNILDSSPIEIALLTCFSTSPNKPRLTYPANSNIPFQLASKAVRLF